MSVIAVDGGVTDRIYKAGKCNLWVERTAKGCEIVGDLFYECDGVRIQSELRPIPIQCDESYTICDQTVKCVCAGDGK